MKDIFQKAMNRIRNYAPGVVVLSLIVWLLLNTACSSSRRMTSSTSEYITISKKDPSYFSTTDGRSYIPIGINLINPSGRYRNNPDSALYEVGQWMKNLSDHGGNYVRIWLSQSFWDIEDEKAGVYREEKAKRIDRFIAMARANHLHIKMTLEHFRSLTPEENPQAWATKSIYHSSNGGPLDSIRQYLRSSAGQKLFLDKVDFYKSRYGADTLFFGWELWNEMNAMRGPEDSVFFAWNEKMLNEVKRRFPQHLVMQSLGSFDADAVRPVYKKMMSLAGNEVAQVHRYLDQGASLKICQQPMDVICASAIEELRSYQLKKPVILAETGAVEPRHTGPSHYYSRDTAGSLLHDILFAPFFTGAAGAGMSWHWESYVDKNNLWYHFKRFSEAVKGIDPVRERFIPSKSETDDLRIYRLTGNKTILIWVRDKDNSWQAELEEGKPPREKKGLHLDVLSQGLKHHPRKVSIYDPWKDTWKDIDSDAMQVSLPDFKRSLVIKIRL